MEETTCNLPLFLTLVVFCMQSTHTIGAVKMRTFEGFDESCSASRSASCSAMLDYGQQFKFKAYAQLTTWTSFYKEHRWQLARNRTVYQVVQNRQIWGNCCIIYHRQWAQKRETTRKKVKDIKTRKLTRMIFMTRARKRSKSIVWWLVAFVHDAGRS